MKFPLGLRLERPGLILIALGLAVAINVTHHHPSTASDSQELQLGKNTPDFTLTDTDGKNHTLSEYTKAGKVVVLEWWNPGCPFVKKHHEKAKTMTDVYTKYAGKNVVWLATNSGAPGKEGAGLAKSKEGKAAYGVKYPILIDESGQVGRLYGAKTTPHMFIVSASGTLLYKGAIDDQPSLATYGKLNYVDRALTEIFAGRSVSSPETKSYGCTVKYAS